MPSLTADDLTALRAAAPVLLPGEPGYEDACTPWNLAISQRPAAVAEPRTVPEVSAAVRAVTALGLRIAPQSTGHGAAAVGDLDRTLLLRLHRLTGVTIDPQARTARVLGGTLWRDVVGVAAGHGLAALHGSAGDVAVAGYVLGGGLSFYGRRHGLASGSVRALEVVTASGDLLRATAQHHADLYWAVRGGGGNFGVVVAIELDLLPIADAVAGMLLWDQSRAPEVVRAWAQWARTAPDGVTTSLRLMRFPPLPELPPFLRGRNIVVIDGAVLGTDDGAAELLRPLRALAPEMDTFARIPAAALIDVHMDPPVPTGAVSDHGMLDDLPEKAIAALLAVAGPQAPVAPTITEIRQLGGALARPIDAALPYLPGAFCMMALCMAPTADLAARGEQVTTRTVQALRPWLNGCAYSNFAERATGVQALYPPHHLDRLRTVRDRYDPQRVWVAAHPAA